MVKLPPATVEVVFDGIDSTRYKLLEGSFTLDDRPLSLAGGTSVLFSGEIQPGTHTLRTSLVYEAPSPTRGFIKYTVPGKFIFTAQRGVLMRVRAHIEGTTGSTFEAAGSGGAVLTINKAKADQINVSGSGGGRITLSGAAKELKVHMTGGTSIKAMDVPAASVSISGSGGAHAEVAASESLEADLSGGAKVQVKGNPTKRSINRSGGAEVRFETS